jgi:hypothetical protein
MARLSLISAIVLAAGCSQPDVVRLESHESQKYSFTQFLNQTRDFPYTAQQEKFLRVRDGFQKLRVGTNKDQVRAALGDPDAEMLNFRISHNEKVLLYTTWAYYLKRRERERYDESFDQVAVLYFKPNDELYWADPGRLAGAIAVGSPDLHPDGVVLISR